MGLLRFADDITLTPISELRQAAKKRAKESNENLASVLDAVAKVRAYPRWDALIASCWTLHPPKSAHNPHPDCHLAIKKGHRQNIMVQMMLAEEGLPNTRDLALSVHDWVENGARQQLLSFSNSPLTGRTLELMEHDRERLSRATTLQSKMRALVPVAVASAANIPLMIGCPDTEYQKLDGMGCVEIPSGDTIRLVAEIPNSGNCYEAYVNIRENPEDLLDWFKPRQVPGMREFYPQGDGSIKARRSKFETFYDALTALKRAARILSFMSWTGLDYPAAKDRRSIISETFQIGPNEAYDNYHVLRHRASNAAVVLNQPYSERSIIGTKGILNLLNPDTITAEAPSFTSLSGTTRVLFHALRSSEVNLEDIVQGAIVSSLNMQHFDIKISKPPTPAPKKQRKPKASSSLDLITPIGHLHINRRQIPRETKEQILSRVPDEKSLVKSYCRSKMKAFNGKRLLSLDLWEMYKLRDVSLDDVVEKLRACPLDADIWCFFRLFDIDEITKAECYRRGVIAGETYLGRDFIEREEGNLGSLPQADAYMRALNLLYRSLVKLGRPADALPIGRWMLRLCSKDKMRLRYTIEQVEAAIENPNLAPRLAQSFSKQDARVK